MYIHEVENPRALNYCLLCPVDIEINFLHAILTKTESEYSGYCYVAEVVKKSFCVVDNLTSFTGKNDYRLCWKPILINTPVLSSCTDSQEPKQKTQQSSTAKQRFVKKGVQWLFPTRTGTPCRQQPTFLSHKVRYQLVQKKALHRKGSSHLQPWFFGENQLIPSNFTA